MTKTAWCAVLFDFGLVCRGSKILGYTELDCGVQTGLIILVVALTVSESIIFLKFPSNCESLNPNLVRFFLPRVG
jgi:hypothetical protein